MRIQIRFLSEICPCLERLFKRYGRYLVLNLSVFNLNELNFVANEAPCRNSIVDTHVKTCKNKYLDDREKITMIIIGVSLFLGQIVAIVKS